MEEDIENLFYCIMSLVQMCQDGILNEDELQQQLWELFMDFFLN